GAGRTVAAGQRLAHQGEALVQAVAAVLHVVRPGAQGRHRVARADDVPQPELERVHIQPEGQVVDDRLDGEYRLRQPVAVEGPRRDRVRIRRVRIDLLVRAAIDAD